MRKISLAALALVPASCGQDQQGGRDEPSQDVARETAVPAPGAPASPPPPVSTRSENLTTFDASEQASGPNVAPTAAPGVAFNYSYAFRLEAQRIAAVQERHAAMCEQLGPNRCRVTGMLYRLRNERDIEARLDLKLEPSIARRFGREGVNVVTQAEGMLVESQITGTDVGSRIRQAGRSIVQMEEDLRRIEARLAGRLSSSECQNLEYEAQQLRSSIRAAQENREEAQESLANTPMTFIYGSGELVPGFDNRRPIRDALRQAGDNFVGGVAALLVIAVTLLPWALLALLVWPVVRHARRRRWFGGATAEAPAREPETAPPA